MKTILTISVNGGVAIPFTKTFDAVFCLREEGMSKEDAKMAVKHAINGASVTGTVNKKKIVITDVRQ